VNDPYIPEMAGPAPAGAESVAASTMTDVAVSETLAPVVELHPAHDERASLVARPWQLVAKRAIDVVGSTILLVTLLPVLLATAAAIALTSRGPVLFVHDRVGKGGRHFSMLKFRSMRIGAHDDLEHVRHLNEVAGPIFKIRNDPRITRVGRVIRKLSIDELPQLLNVLKGDMSLVGPRPPLPEEYATYGPRERGRLDVRPGLTCTWQVSGRSDLDFETWVEMDLEYIRDWSLRRDLVLMAKTVPAVLSRRGAY
jgi:lipopolysaccharide/colanic/teichoic acid biosynthesis glycosyltransferase